jgi:GNAT superfamily N-acetyltransferase
MSPDRVGAVCSFFARAYADQPIGAAFRDIGRVLERWRWLNEGNPDRLDDELPAWLCLKRGEIVGHFGVLPAVAVSQGQAIPVCWGRDLIVSPEQRQQGIGPILILTAVMAAHRPFLIAGLNDAVYPIYRRLGFLDLGSVPLYLKIYQPDRLMETFQWPGLARHAAALAVTVSQRLRRRRGKNNTLSLQATERFDERFDSWWRRVEKSFPCVVRRTSATLNWRYHCHPFHRYTTVAATDGEGLRGILIVRHGHSRGLPAGFISELLAHPDDREAIETLVEHAEELLRSSAAEPEVFIRCVVLHRSFEHALARAGFLRVPSPIRWMLAHAEGSSALGPLARRDGWFLNGGDSDLDML